MNEVIHQFGEQNRLVGIATIPDNRPFRNTGMIILNSGLLAKSGAFRFSVNLARTVAKNNHCLVFRFDFGGIGDSETGLSSETFIERSSLEIQLAIDLLSKEYGIETYIIGGLCSAADCAIQLSEDNNQIAGLLLIDPPGYKTKSFFRWKQIKRILRTLHSLDFSRFANVLKKIRPYSLARSSSLNFRTFPSREEFSRKLERLIDSKKELFIAYTGGSMSYYNHKNQFHDMFPKINFLQQLDLFYLPKSDHLSILKKDQNQLIELISTWYSNRFEKNTDCD